MRSFFGLVTLRRPADSIKEVGNDDIDGIGLTSATIVAGGDRADADSPAGEADRDCSVAWAPRQMQVVQAFA